MIIFLSYSNIQTNCYNNYNTIIYILYKEINHIRNKTYIYTGNHIITFYVVHIFTN